MKQKKRDRPRAKQPIKQAKRRSSARNNKKRKRKDTKIDHLKRIALFVLQPAQTVDQMKSGFNALHVKSGPTKSALIDYIGGVTCT